MNIIYTAIISILLFIIGLFFVQSGSLGYYTLKDMLSFGYIFGAIPWGWKQLNFSFFSESESLPPNVVIPYKEYGYFLGAKLIFGVIKLFIKILISSFVGIFVAPFMIINKIIQWKKEKK